MESERGLGTAQADRARTHARTHTYAHGTLFEQLISDLKAEVLALRRTASRPLPFPLAAVGPEPRTGRPRADHKDFRISAESEPCLFVCLFVCLLCRPVVQHGLSDGFAAAFDLVRADARALFRSLDRHGVGATCNLRYARAGAECAPRDDAQRASIATRRRAFWPLTCAGSVNIVAFTEGLTNLEQFGALRSIFEGAGRRSPSAFFDRTHARDRPTVAASQAWLPLGPRCGVRVGMAW
jgi:hypothetical protein